MNRKLSRRGGGQKRTSSTPGTSTSERGVEAYLEFDPDTFRGKVVYCNCDDPFESNFFKYFATNFNRLRLKRLGQHQL